MLTLHETHFMSNPPLGIWGEKGKIGVFCFFLSLANTENFSTYCTSEEDVISLFLWVNFQPRKSGGLLSGGLPSFIVDRVYYYKAIIYTV